MIEEFKHFNKHEAKILNFLYRIRIKQSPTAIAKRLKMHWTTVETALYNLEDKRWVIRTDMENKTLWQFNIKGYNQLKRKKK